MKTVKDYLSEAIADFQSLGEPQTQILFLLALKDYFNHTINIKCLSSVATQLYYTYNKPFTIDTRFEHDLAHVLQDITELEYYLREGNKEPRYQKIAEEILRNLQEYYQKNKVVLINTLGGKANP